MNNIDINEEVFEALTMSIVKGVVIGGTALIGIYQFISYLKG